MDDFTFLSLLNGCDFIPRLRGFYFPASWSEYLKKSELGFKEQYLVDFNAEKLTLNVNWELFERLLKENAKIKESEPKPPNIKDFINLLVFPLFRVYVEYRTKISDGIIEAIACVDRTPVGKGVGNSSNKATEEAAWDALRGDILFQMVQKKTGCSRQLYDESLEEFLATRNTLKISQNVSPIDGMN